MAETNPNSVPTVNTINQAMVIQAISESNKIQEYFQELISKPGEKNYTSDEGKDISCYGDFSLTTIINELKDKYRTDPDVQILDSYLKELQKKDPPEDIVIKNYEVPKLDYDNLDENGFPKGKSVPRAQYGRNLTIDVTNGEEHNYYVEYKGTGSGEGVSNGEGMYKESTYAQRDALDYFERMVEHSKSKAGWEDFTDINLGGHSNGSNKCMFVTMSSKYADLIKVCVAEDGEGFSPALIDLWMSNPAQFEERRSKIIAVYGENDYVHTAGIPIVKDENIYTVKFKYDTKNDVMSAPAAWHAHEYLFHQKPDGTFTHYMSGTNLNEVIPNEDGSMSYSVEYGTESNLCKNLKSFFEKYMYLPEDQIAATAPGLMTLIWKAQAGDGVDPDMAATVIKTCITFLELPIDFILPLISALCELGEADPGFTTILYLKLAALLGINPAITGVINTAVNTAVIIELIRKAFENKKTGNYHDNGHDLLNDSAAQKQAGETADFYIDPETLLTCGMKYNMIGGDIASWKNALIELGKEPIPQISTPDTTGSSLSEQEEIEALVSECNQVKKRIEELQKTINESASLLENVIGTLNGVITYMYDSGAEFTIVEQGIISKMESWPGSNISI